MFACRRLGYTDLMRAAYEGDITRVAELVFRDAANNKHVYLVKRECHLSLCIYSVYYVNV
jgi:hypothetical protein